MNREYEGFQKCIVLISRAENLLDGNEKKNKKPNKWQVIITGCKKKYQTNYAACHVGNPFWNQTLEIKLIREQIDHIVLNVIDISHNHYGQIVIPLSQIRTSTQINGDTSSRYSNLQCCELEPSPKCSNPLGILFFSITSVAPSPDELVNPKANITKRHSIFGLKFEPKASRKLSFMESTPHIAINHYDSKHLPKRLSVSKSNEKPGKFNIVRAKAKSVANIHAIEDIDHYFSSSDLDSPKQPYLPPDDVYAKVTLNHGWVRVAEMCNDNSRFHYDANSINEIDQAHVDLFSIKPNQGPTTGNFTVVIEGTNFESGLFDLTYVCIDGLEPIDSTTCTQVLSDTELSLTMPPVPVSGMVNIDLELLDGSRIRCSENFLYTNSPVDSPINNGLKTIEFENTDELFDQLFDHYDDSMPQSDKENKTTSRTELNMVAKSSDFHLLDRRKNSDYGSQGSFRSDRTSSIRKKVKKINMTKEELVEDVEKLRNQVTDLTSQLSGLESTWTVQIDTLKCQLESREKEIDYLSSSLCKLKMQLFNDGLHKYLELM